MPAGAWVHGLLGLPCRMAGTVLGDDLGALLPLCPQARGDRPHGGGRAARSSHLLLPSMALSAKGVQLLPRKFSSVEEELGTLSVYPPHLPPQSCRAFCPVSPTPMPSTHLEELVDHRRKGARQLQAPMTPACFGGTGLAAAETLTVETEESCLGLPRRSA